MPHAFELPRMLGAVMPLVRRKWLAGFSRRIVNKFVALALRHPLWSRGRLARRGAGLVPGLAAVVRALNDLPEPPACLRCINSIRVGGRTLHVIDLPAAKIRAPDLPFLTLAVGTKNECASARTSENTDMAHVYSCSLKNFQFYGQTQRPSTCKGLGSRCRHLRSTSRRSALRFFAITSTAAGGSSVLSCRAPQLSNSSRTGARPIPFLLRPQFI